MRNRRYRGSAGKVLASRLLRVSLVSNGKSITPYLEYECWTIVRQTMNETPYDAPRMDWGESKAHLRAGLKWTDLNRERPREGTLVHIRGNGNVSSGVYQSGHFEWWRCLADDPSASVEWAYTSSLMADLALLRGKVA